MRGIRKNTVFSLFGLLGLLLASGALLGSTYTIQQSTLYPYKNSIALQDEFLGATANLTIGALGWSINGGATANAGVLANRIGLLNRDTGAVINTVAATFLYSGTSQAIRPQDATRIIFALRLNTNDANTKVRAGAMSSVTVDPPADGIYLEKDAADTTWFCVTRAAGVQTRTNTTLNVTTNFVTLEYTRNSSGVTYKVDGVDTCGLQTTNITTTSINPSVQIVTTAAAAKNLDIDYFQLNISGIVR